MISHKTLTYETDHSQIEGYDIQKYMFYLGEYVVCYANMYD